MDILDLVQHMLGDPKARLNMFGLIGASKMVGLQWKIHEDGRWLGITLFQETTMCKQRWSFFGGANGPTGRPHFETPQLPRSISVALWTIPQPIQKTWVLSPVISSRPLISQPLTRHVSICEFSKNYLKLHLQHFEFRCFVSSGTNCSGTLPFSAGTNRSPSWVESF